MLPGTIELLIYKPGILIIIILKLFSSGILLVYFDISAKYKVKDDMKLVLDVF